MNDTHQRKRCHVFIFILILKFLFTAINSNSIAADIKPYHPIESGENATSKLLLELAESALQAGQEKVALLHARSASADFEARFRDGTKLYCSARNSKGYMACLVNYGLSNRKGGIEFVTEDWPRAYAIEGYALRQLGDTGGAMNATFKARRLSPSNPRYARDIGDILFVGKSTNWHLIHIDYQL
ncbi:hypothetical protein D9M68_446840 [compost metagenome]